MTAIVSSPELRLCDDDFFYIGIVDYEKFTYEERWNGRDTWEMTLMKSVPIAEFVRVGRVLHYYDPDEAKIRALVIKQIDVDDTQIKATGNDYLGDLFGVRLALTGTTSNTGYDTQTGDAESVMLHYIRSNILEDASRGDPVLRLETVNHQRGQNVEIAARFQALLEVLESCCTQGYVGWEGVVVEDTELAWGWAVEFRVRVGLDHSQMQTEISPIILSEEFGTAKISRFTDTLPEGSLAVVAGQGEAADRIQVMVGESTQTGLARRELFVDARDVETIDQLQKRGSEALADAEMTSIEVDYLASGSFKYPSDFCIGDIVTVDVGTYGAYDLSISVVKRTWSVDEQEIVITLGAEVTDVVRLIREQTRKNPDRRR